MMIREMFEDMPVVGIIFTLTLIGFVFTLTDESTSKPEYFSGNVIDKHYSAKSRRTGTGLGVTGSGQAGVGKNNEIKPERFLLMVKTENGKVVAVNCEPELYYEKEIGDSIEFVVYKGRFTGTSWSFWGVR